MLAKKAPRDVARLVEPLEIAQREHARGVPLLGERAVGEAPRVVLEDAQRARPVVALQRGVRIGDERELGVERRR